MRRTRTLASWSGLAVLAAALSIPLTTAEAAPSAPPSLAASAAADEGGRGPSTAASASKADRAEVARRAAAAPPVADPIAMPTSYPYQPSLRFYRDNPNDAATFAGLYSHADLAPQLTEWMQQSDRISTQVIGESTAGRDLYLVTVTSPEREEDTAQQTGWKEKLRTDPAAAAADTQLLAQYKTPVWFSANIHGNEWEGTDGAMDYIEWLVTSPMSEVGGILRNNRLYFSLTLNPDGRTVATRATTLGFDENRDMITNILPESRSFVRTAQAIQPIYSADLHGYTGVLQVEPCGPPHGTNYEYDLYLPHNYAVALKVEQDVTSANIPGNTYRDPVTGNATTTNTGQIILPYRDTPSGWDDFPPIFTAQYAAYYGAATTTVELPLGRNGGAGRQSPANAAVNRAVALETITSMVEYMNNTTNAREMLLNQAKVFQRGIEGTPKVQVTTANIAGIPGPAQWKPLWDVVDDQEPVTLPRAYVIPVGDDQRSASDASRLVQQLLFHDIEVDRLTADTTVGDTTYPAGSYVVDMHQSLRGLANSLLDVGEDISLKVPSMYDVSAWSLGNLWGATVDKVGLNSDPAIGATEPVTGPDSNYAMPEAGYTTFDVAGVSDFAAVNALLEDEVPVSMLEDGSAVVGSDDRDAVAAVAEEFDIAVSEATEGDLEALDDESTKGLSDLNVGYVGNQEDRESLAELGFDDLTQLTAAGVNSNPAVLDPIDVLWIGASFTQAVGSPGRTAVQAFVDSGRSIVGRTNQAFNTAVTYGLLSGTAVTGNTSGNGIVDIDTPDGSVLEPYAQDSAFIYPAYWFTGLGSDVEVAQTYDATDPLLAGHWRPSGAGTNGPANAAGQASVVSNEVASGARSVVFGIAPVYRTHTKGGLSQAARALHWAGPAGPEVVAPEAPPAATSVALSGDSPVTYPDDVVLDVTVSSAGGTPTGSVAILDEAGDEVATADLDGAGGAVVPVEGVLPGDHTFTAVYTPDSEVFAGSESAEVPVQVNKAPSTLGIRRTGTEGGRVTFAITLDIRNLPSKGTVRILDRGRVIRNVTFGGNNDTRSVTLTLGRGQHAIQAAFPATPVALASRSRTLTFTVR